MKPRGSLAIDNRRERVVSLAARGFSVRQIAQALKEKRSNIERDLQAVRPILRHALEETAEDLYTDASAELNEVRQQLWLNYARAAETEIGLRIAILNSIVALPERRARLGQSLGLVVEAPERIEIIMQVQRALADALMSAEPEEADRLAQKLLEIAHTP